MKEIKYNVIWIDDEWTKMSAFKDECEVIHGIHLEPFTTQKSGMEELDRNLNSWDAVILDAKMFDESEDETPKLDGLRKAIRHIDQLSMKKSIPYFISTGQPDLMDNDTFSQSFGHFYVKEKDDLELIDKLKEAIDSTSRRQVQSLYSDAIEQLSKIAPDAKEAILDIFEAMHFPDMHKDFKPVLYYNQLRQILESVFRVANKVEIIPDVCIQNDVVNLNQCCHYLSGNNAKQLEIRYGAKNERVVPKHIQDIMFLILSLGNTNSHTVQLNEDEEKTLSEYIHTNVYNSKYLIYSLALQVCEVVMWMNRYISTHQNIEENRRMCQSIQIDTQKDETSEAHLSEGIIEPLENNLFYCRIGSNYCINANYAKRNNLIGKKVLVIEKEENKDKNTKEQFPFFATKVKQLE